jgi:hypothetical protein
VKKGMVFTVALVIAAIPVSFVMAFVMSSPFEKLGVRTPGMLVSDAFVHPSSPSQGFAVVGTGLRVQIIADWVFWFGFLCALFALLHKLWQKFGRSS